MDQDRFKHNVDHSDDSRPALLRRVEVITGVERRRRWSTEQKFAIVSESLVEGAVVSEVARRHAISPQQLFGWRAKLRDEMVAQLRAEPALFAPVRIDEVPMRSSVSEPVQRPDDRAEIEITLGAAVVRIRGAVDAGTLAAALKALKAIA